MRSKLKSGALVYVIVLSLIIMSMLGLMIMRNYYLCTDINLVEEREHIRDNINSTIEILEEDIEILKYGEEQELFDGSRIKVKIDRQAWGMLDLIKIKARGRVFCDSVVMLSTGMKAKNDSTALWITDKRNYISIGGNSLLKGKCYIPRLGVRKGYIEKESYRRDKLIYGEVQKSKAEIPALSKDILDRNIKVYDYEKVTDLEDDSLEHSFLEETKIIYHAEDIDLSGVSLSGNIKVISEQRILVDSTSCLNKVILCAPEVVIDEGFRGNLQVFAACRMTVGESVHLEYPSYIFMKSRIGKVEMHVGKNAEICGGIIISGNDDSSLLCSVGTVVKGQVYVKGYSSLQGKIYGSAYLDKLFFNTRWSKYEDVLFNTVIDRSALDDDMPVLDLFECCKKQILVSWEH